MCGRFAAFWDDQAIGYRLDADPQPGLPGPSWNVAPTQTVAVAVEGTDGHRRLAPAYWTLIPPTSPTRQLSFPTFNARSETALERPTFRAAAEHFRAIFPVNGYYEWDQKHHPWYFSPTCEKIHADSQIGQSADPPEPVRATDRATDSSSSHVLWIGGLCSWWRDPQDGRWLLTATILTRPAIGRAVNVHERMPLLVPDPLIEPWLNRSYAGKDAFESVQSAAQKQEQALATHEVAPLHGDGPSLLTPVQSPVRTSGRASRSTQKLTKESARKSNVSDDSNDPGAFTGTLF